MLDEGIDIKYVFAGQQLGNVFTKPLKGIPSLEMTWALCPTPLKG